MGTWARSLQNPHTCNMQHTCLGVHIPVCGATYDKHVNRDPPHGHTGHTWTLVDTRVPRQAHMSGAWASCSRGPGAAGSERCPGHSLPAPSFSRPQAAAPVDARAPQGPAQARVEGSPSRTAAAQAPHRWTPGTCWAVYVCVSPCLLWTGSGVLRTGSQPLFHINSGCFLPAHLRPPGCGGGTHSRALSGWWASAMPGVTPPPPHPRSPGPWAAVGRGLSACRASLSTWTPATQVMPPALLTSSPPSAEPGRQEEGDGEGLGPPCCSSRPHRWGARPCWRGTLPVTVGGTGA